MDFPTTDQHTIGLLSFLAWVPVVAIVHELGHALVASTAGFRVTSFGIGRGRPIVRIQMPGAVVFHVGWLFFTGGACVAIPRSPESRPRAALFHGGGIAAQVVLGMILLLLPSGPWSPWIDAGGHFNLLVAAWNLLPWRVGRVASDGWWLFSRLTQGAVVPHRALFEQRRAIEQILAHETRVRSPIGIWYGHLMLAWCDLLTGREASAFDRLEQVISLPVMDRHLSNIEALVRAEAAVRSGHPMLALRMVEAAAVDGTEPNDTADLLTVVEARAWLALGVPFQARRAIGRLAGIGGAIGREAMSVTLKLAVQERDRPAIHATAYRLVHTSTQGMIDPIAASLALDQASLVADDPDTATRWRARAVGIARAAVDQASAEDKPSLHAVLDRILHDSTNDTPTTATRPVQTTA